MPNHYVYRLDHDTGFAPHVWNRTCTLCGCKTTTIERWARQGSWVVGVGGVRTGQRDALIYAMEVETTPSVAELRHRRRRLAAYLLGRPVQPGATVLVSRRFYYFGDKAVPLPKDLQHILIQQQGCKKLTDAEVARLSAYLARRFSYGAHGKPNNRPHVVRSACGCRSC